MAKSRVQPRLTARPRINRAQASSGGSSRKRTAQPDPRPLSESREPEPDVTVATGTIDDYRDRHPTAAECLAAIEVAASSLEFDRCVKTPIYAAAGIPVYWIVNIPECRIEVYESPIPSEGRYRNRVDYKPSDTIKLTLGAGQAIDVAVDEILPTSNRG